MSRPDTSTYGAIALLQRVCTYVYDAVVIPYIANTYAPAATITVISGAYQCASTPTTATAHSSRHNSKSGRKQAVGAPCRSRSAACCSSVPSYTYDYDGTIPQRNEPTPTTTDSTRVTYVETPAIPPSLPASGTPTAHSEGASGASGSSLHISQTGR